MNTEDEQQIRRMWDSVCPVEFQEIAPSTLFTTKYGRSVFWSKFPTLYFHKNQKIDTFTQKVRENVESPLFKRRDPVPRERFSITEKFEPYNRKAEETTYINIIKNVLGSMIVSKDKIVCAKQTPTYIIREAEAHRFVERDSRTPFYKVKTLGYGGHCDGNSPYTVWHGGDIILLSRKGYIFTFMFLKNMDKFNQNSQSLTIDIYDIRHVDKSLNKNFITNVVNVYLDHMIYNTPDFVYDKIKCSGYINLFAQQFRFDEDIVDTLIVLVYAQLHIADDQQSIQKQSTIKSVPAQQQSYFQKQEKRMLKQIQSKKQQEQKRIRSIQDSLNKKASELEKRQRSIRQKQLVELPEYLTDVAGDLSIMNDPVIASDGFTYSRRTAENIVRNRLNGRAGSRIRIIGPNHDMRKSINQFITKYEQVQDGKYRKK